MRASVFIAVVAVAFAPATAAAQGVSTFEGTDCPAGSLCLFADRHFTGGAGDRVPDLDAHQLADQVSSWTNDTGVTCSWYESANYFGRAHEMLDGHRVELPPRENDTPSSVECG